MEKEIRFGKHLKNLRESKGMLQRELADALEIKQNSLSSYENGKRYPEMFTLLKIAGFFDVSLDDLVYQVDEETKENIEENEQIIIDIEKGLSVEEMASKYNFIVDGEELPKESIEKVLDQIKYEYYKMKKII